jgi:2,5-diketo-D-gluconate reductase A
MTATTAPTIRLHDQTTIPQLGFGVFQIPPADTAQAVSQALEVGYRHVDTAQMYGNEAGVGEALAGSGLPREEIYVASKLSNAHHRPDDARRSFDETLRLLRVDRIDLFLVHWPLPTRYDGDLVSTWQTLAGFVKDGRAASIGVSNFQPDHLDRIIEEVGVVPVVNQVEVHPYFRNEEVREANARHGIATEAWSPIAQGAVLDDPVVVGVAEEVGATPSQVTLRWHLQRGDIVFPKSTRPERMGENFGALDIELDEQQMAAIDGLDRGEAGRRGPHPDSFDLVPD